MEKEKIEEIIKQAESNCSNSFALCNDIAYENQKKVLDAFRQNGLQSRHFVGSSGYGYDDIGKECTKNIFATIFHTEDAIVSPLLTCGTQALYHTLFGVLRSGDTMYCVAGKPYDSLDDIIFAKDRKQFCLENIGIKTIISELKNADFDFDEIEKNVLEFHPKVVYIQRSRGYAWRQSLSCEKIEKLIKTIKNLTADVIFLVDNCYGTFCEKVEPTDVGADIVVGSMIKNAGGGYAQTGAYIAGKKYLIQQINEHIFSPALGGEVGSYALGYKSFLQGIFVAPSVVKNAKMVALLFAEALKILGYQTLPSSQDKFLSDIICSIKFEDEQKLISFCKSIQSSSPVDNDAVPEPWNMPGYADKVIMAAGAFVLGSTIELSCDGPIRPPYIAYLQGSLTYEHGKIALAEALKNL